MMDRTFMSVIMHSHKKLFLAALVLLVQAGGGRGGLVGVQAFYLPEINPRDFVQDELVKLRVNKLTSTKTLLPLDYYSLPFCEPYGGPILERENLGEILGGDRIETSPYTLLFKKDMYCEHLCISDFGGPRVQSNKQVVKAIRDDYHHNWIVDNLPSASKLENDELISVRHEQGMPIGFVGSVTIPFPSTLSNWMNSVDDHADGRVYINNHFNIEIRYHPIEDAVDRYRIVRFTVQPFSIQHNINVDENLANIDLKDESYRPKQAKLINPIPSCLNIPPSQKQHTSYDMVTASDQKPQEPLGEVLFTYDVIWLEDLNAKWATRWDFYLGMREYGPIELHWLSIASSFVIIMALLGMVIVILLHNLRRDLNRYNKLAQSDQEMPSEDLNEYGWKLVHADVFRPPTTAPMLLSVACGTGAQLLCMSFLVIIFSALGFMSPARRGHLLMAQLLLFVVLGSVAGYVTARLYKTFQGQCWKHAALMTAIIFPGIAFLTFSIMNIVPFTTSLILVLLWIGISTPLVFCGAYFGYQKDVVEFPVKTSSCSRQVPHQPWFLSMPFTMATAGILPFGSCFVELYYILDTVWNSSDYYCIFGFLLLVFLILIITCAEITVLFTYFQLRSEDYRWWWRSFANAGSVAIYVFLYSIVSFQQKNGAIATYVVYFGRMGLACTGLFTMMGFVGLVTSLWFNKTIFASIKID